MFTIDHLSISLHGQPILNSINLCLAPGSTHVLMGPNGSGKSTLAYAIMGHPKYHRDSGTITYNGKKIHEMAMHLRAQAGIFIAFQHPLEIPGITVERFLVETCQTHTALNQPIATIKERIAKALDLVKLPASFAQRAVNVGFSGGEKKRLELVQMLVLSPAVVILDEIDSGLDIDGLQVVNAAIQALREHNPNTIIIIISHHAHIAQYLQFDQLHIMKSGKIIATGNTDLISKVQERGYEHFTA